MVPRPAFRVAALALLAALPVTAGCAARVDGRAHALPASTTAAPAPPFGDPEATASATGMVLPPIGITLQRVLADPDPRAHGPLTGTVTIDRLTAEKSLAVADINCLRANVLRVGFVKESAGQPLMATWALELASPPGARNCAEQMRRTDQSDPSYTDLSATYQLPGVSVYRMVDHGAHGQRAVFRGIYTAGPRLFRVTTSGGGVIAPIERVFRALLDRQVGLAPAG